MISDISDIYLVNDLDKAYDEIGDLKSGLDALNVSTNNGIIEYNKYIELKKKR